MSTFILRIKSRYQSAIKWATKDRRGSTEVIMMVALVAIGLVAGGVVFTTMSKNLDETLREKPSADVSIDPGAEKATVVINSLENTAEMNVTVNGVSVYNHTGKSLPAAERDHLSLSDAAGSNTVNISHVDSTAWQNGRIASNTTIIVTATTESGYQNVVYEFTQP